MKTAAKQIASRVGLAAVFALIAAGPLSAQIQTESAYTSPFCILTTSIVPDELKVYCDRERQRQLDARDDAESAK
jgi:hypothetical protein